MTTRSSGGGTRQAFQALIDAINSGDIERVEQLAEEIGKGLLSAAPVDIFDEGGLSPEQDRALNEALEQAPREVIMAFTQGSVRGGGVLTGVGPVAGGGPQILSRTTAGGLKSLGEGVSEEAYSAVMSPAARSMLNKVAGWIFGRTAGGFVKRAVGAGIGVSAFNTIIGEPDGGPTVPANLDPTTGEPAPPPMGAHPRGRPGLPAGKPPQVTGPGIGPLPPDPGFNIMFIDHKGEFGTPGAVVVLTSTELGVSGTPAIDAAIAAGDPTGAGVGVIDIVNQSISQGGNVSTQGGRKVVQTIFPESLGDVQMATPVQVRPEFQTVTAQSPISELRPQPPPGTDPRFWQINVDDLPPDRVENPAVNVPAGGVISPRIFTSYRGRTLMEWASISAQRYQVPLSLLYGLIAHESGWNMNAQNITPRERSYGLAQINLLAWPGISKGQALNPIFAMEWTAQKLRDRFQTYGSWEAAVAAHNSPVAADYLARTGKFQTEKSSNYVNDVLGRANSSGLGTYIFDTGETGPETFAQGPTYTPFQAPDPAASKEYIRGVFEDLLGRQPNESELATGVKKIENLARQAYQANLTQLKGGESQEVDPEAQYLESIRETGEFEFHEEVTEQRKFTDFAANIARLMQTGV